MFSTRSIGWVEGGHPHATERETDERPVSPRPMGGGGWPPTWCRRGKGGVGVGGTLQFCPIFETKLQKTKSRKKGEQLKTENWGVKDELERRFLGLARHATTPSLAARLRGLNDMPFGRPTPGRPIGRPGVGRPQGVFGVF
jgi:hypothetical protein